MPDTKHTKRYLVVLNRYDKNQENPRIETVFFIATAENKPNTADLKRMFTDAVNDAVLNTPMERYKAENEPDYQVCYSDVHRLPEDSLHKHSLSLYKAENQPSFTDIIVLNVYRKQPFDLSWVRI